MYRSEPNFPFFEEKYQQQESECEDEASIVSMNESLHSSDHSGIESKTGDMLKTNQGLSESEGDQTKLGSDTYHNSFDENNTGIMASGSEYMILYDYDSRISCSVKRITPGSDVNIECDNADDDSMVKSPDTKKAKRMVCLAKAPEKIEENCMVCSRKGTILEVQQNLGSKRKYIESSKESDNSSLSGFFPLLQPKCNSDIELGSNAPDLSGEKNDNNSEKKDSISSSLARSSKSSLELREGDKNIDFVSVSSSSEEYLKILEASQKIDCMGNNFFKNGDYQDALASYSKALRVKRKTLECGLHLNARNKKDLTDRLLASVATSINNIGYLLQRSGVQMCEVMAAYKDSLQIKQKILGNEHLSVGRTLNNIGSVYFKNRDYHAALESYEQAQKIMIANLGLDHLDVATVYSNTGDVYLSSKNPEIALQKYKESLRIRWSQLGHGHSKVTRLLEKIAAIEMADTPQQLKQQQLYDVTNNNSNTHNDHEDDLRELERDIQDDLSYVQRMSRKLALDMIRDRVKMIRQMRRLEAGKGEIPFEMMNINSNGNIDSCSIASSTGYESDSSMILHGRKNALTYLTESAARAKEEELSSTAHGTESCLSSESSFISPPPAMVRAVSNDFEERFDETAELLTEDWSSS